MSNKNTLSKIFVILLIAVILFVAMTSCTDESVPKNYPSTADAAERADLNESVVSSMKELETYGKEDVPDSTSDESVIESDTESNVKDTSVMKTKSKPESDRNSESETHNADREETESKEDEVSEIKFDYEQIYTDFMNSGEWRTYENVAFPDIDINQCNIICYSIFDLDGNAVPDLWLYAESGFIGSDKTSASGFYTIYDGEVATIMTGSTVGEEMNGDTVTFSEEVSTGKLYLTNSKIIGGFGGRSETRTIYDFVDSEMSLKTEFYALEWQNFELGTNEYKIDDVNVYQNDFQRKLNEYGYINPADVPRKTK